MANLTARVDELLALAPVHLHPYLCSASHALLPALIASATQPDASLRTVMEAGCDVMRPYAFAMKELPTAIQSEDLRQVVWTYLATLKDTTQANVDAVVVALRCLLLWNPPKLGCPLDGGWLSGVPPAQWIHPGDDWDGAILFSFGAGFQADVGVDEVAPNATAEEINARARKLTPQPHTPPESPLAVFLEGSSVPSEYDIPAACRWRGGSNLGLAAALLGMLQKSNSGVKAIASQWEIHDLLHGLPDQKSAEGLWMNVDSSWQNCKTVGLPESAWHGIYPPAEGYLNSPLVAKAGLKHLQSHGCSKILVIAQPEHLTRALQVTADLMESEYAGSHFSIVGVNWEAVKHDWERFGCDKHGYWPQSAQPWTQSLQRFIGHEVGARFHDSATLR
eukprot:TRINITY_DN30956_c0_g1_i1.p1 TRINITY_DN30956_c0_g1~~TRINITY_DN30956_c0_g1_i1.p1  ORF type:complete len:410 (-),score=18.39 TRINITY_DN30956_c0_g1_i1:127-1302(-)